MNASLCLQKYSKKPAFVLTKSLFYPNLRNIPVPKLDKLHTYNL